jgi:putative DNA primase/helicase
MIGKPPDTVDDRALVVPLRRKQAGEAVERFRADRLAEFLPLRRKAARWAADNLMRLRDMDPDVPEALNDRAQDNARAICAISDVAGGIWPGLVRTAFVGLAGQADDEPQSAGVLLLRDVNEIFETRGIAQIGSAELCTVLCALEESPWGEWRRGSPITSREAAETLWSEAETGPGGKQILAGGPCRPPCKVSLRDVGFKCRKRHKCHGKNQ